MLGISYGGWLTVMAMIDPHPALKAVSEQASPADMFLGDDFHHNGAFRLSYGLEYSALMETCNTNFHFQFDKYDTFEWYLALGALANFNSNYGHEKLPTWNDFVAHPNYDEFWQKQAVTPYLDAPKVPNLNVAGWWDQEDFYGPMKIYETLEKKDTNHLNYVVAGPWNHGGWSSGAGSQAGRHRLRQRNRRVLSRESAGAMVRLLAERQRNPAATGSAHVSDGLEPLGVIRRMAAAQPDHRPAALFPAVGISFVPEARRRRGVRQLRIRPRASGSVPAPADQPDVSRGRLDPVARGGPALRRSRARTC